MSTPSSDLKSTVAYRGGTVNKYRAKRPLEETFLVMTSIEY